MRMYKVLKLVSVLLLLASCLAVGKAQAQLNTSNHWEISPFAGPFLSNSIEGIEDVLFVSGLHVNKGFSYYRPELFYFQGQKDQQKIQVLALSMKNPVLIPGVNDIVPFVLTGLQLLRAEPLDDQTNGFHIALGMDLEITPRLQLRNEYMLLNGSGRALMISVGLQFLL